MFRWFLSLRYLRARRTNWIGVAGIFVAVAALILILSIMAGFLHESRQHLRGNLADVLVMPRMDVEIRERGMPRTDPEPLLEVIREQPGVAAATPGCSRMTSSRGSGSVRGIPRSRISTSMRGMTRTSARLPRRCWRLSCRKPAMIERIRIRAATATKMPATPIQLVRRARR